MSEENGPTTPEQVRAAREEMRGVRETRVAARSQFELREIPNGSGGTNLRFTGFACVTEAEYEMEDWVGPWTESVSIGAFKKTLSEGADVCFLLNHEGMTLARTKPGTLKLSEQTDQTTSPILGVTGLYSEALLDPTNMYVQAMRSAVVRGDLDEMSFAFRVMRQEWNDDGTRRWLNELNLDKGDTSLVNYGANPTTGGTVSLRQRLAGRGVSPDRLAMAVKRSRLFTALSDGTLQGASDKLLAAFEKLDSCDDADTPGLLAVLSSIDEALAIAPPEPEPTEPEQRVYRDADFAYGLRCSGCASVFEDGQPILERSIAEDGVEPICERCNSAETEERSPVIISIAPVPDHTQADRALLARYQTTGR